MTQREILLEQLKLGLSDGIISAQDVASLVNLPAQPSPDNIQATTEIPVHDPTPQLVPAPDPAEHKKDGLKLNAVQLLYLVGGFILYIAICTFLYRMIEDNGALAAGAVSSMIGLSLWSLAIYFKKSVAPGTKDPDYLLPMVLTGSLSISGGIVLLLSDTAQASDAVYRLCVLAGLVSVATINYIFDRFIKSPVTIVVASVAAAATFISMVDNITGGFESENLFGLTLIVSALILGWLGRLITARQPEREDFEKSFQSLAVFATTATAFILATGNSVDELKAVWTFVFLTILYGLFYASIKLRNKNFLLTGALFLILGSISLTYQYLGGLDITLSFTLVAFSILGSGFMASKINKKYIKDDI